MILQNKKILFLVPNAKNIGDMPTGIWLEEFAVPYLKFTSENFGVKTASLLGGQAYITPSALLHSKEEWAFANEILARTEVLDNINFKEFDALFIPGGQAAMVDFPNNPKINNIAKQFLLSNKVIGTLSHGAAAFIGAKDDRGASLIKDKELCAFSNNEEMTQFAYEKLPFLIEDKLKEEGAIFKCSNMIDEPFTVVSNNLVTGQNHYSGQKLAEKMISLLV